MEDKILVNDTITIDKEKCGNAYTGFNKWFNLYGISTDNYDKVLSQHIEDDNIDERYRCIWMAPHLTTGEMLYAIRGLHTQKVFLINKDAILVYNHTCGSLDNTDVVLKILSSEYSKLELKLEEIKSYIEEHSVAAPVDNSNTMPELEDEMYGIIISNDDNETYKFRVARGCIFMDNGWVYSVDDFINGCFGIFEIIEVSFGVNCFDNYDYGTVIWTKA